MTIGENPTRKDSINTMSETSPPVPTPLNIPMPKHPGGRPTKLTEQLIQDICEPLRNGNYIETACDLAGIATPTWRDWLEKGSRMKSEGITEDDPSGGLLVKFSSSVKRAMAEFEVNTTRKIGDDKQWTARAWLLERTRPGKFGQRVINEGKQDITVTIKTEVLPPVSQGQIEPPTSHLVEGEGYTDIVDD